ncbi:MAG: 4a-hydroxytetrahydrobiopterin dehydratase [Cumulibacter sp.]
MGQLTATEIRAADLPDWRYLACELHARFRTGDFVTGAELVADITVVAQAANHHPDLSLSYPYLDVRLMSHDVGAVTERDLDLAAQISQIAAAKGIAADPRVLAELDVALDASAHGTVGEFWAVVLAGSRDALVDDMITDPHGRLPRLWLQATEPHPEPRQRFHYDLWVAEDTLDERIAAALTAGGVIVDDQHAPDFVVLADPEGNKVCLCTQAGRG